jgi:hypothetical protein
MLLFQLLPEWKKLPNLAKSVICTTSKIGANDWGPAYRVYPFDGAKLGITPEEHMWASFPTLFASMNTLNGLLQNIIETNMYKVKSNETNPQILKDVFNLIDKKTSRDFIDLVLDYTDPTYLVEKYFLQYKNREFETLIDMFSVILKPDDFLLKKAGDKGLPPNKQVWTEGDCIMKSLHKNRDVIIEEE